MNTVLTRTFEKWDRLAELRWQSQLPDGDRRKLVISDTEALVLYTELHAACVEHHREICRLLQEKFGEVLPVFTAALDLAKYGDERALMGRWFEKA